MKKLVLTLLALVACGCANHQALSTGVVTIKGTPFETFGNRVYVGETAPEFTALDSGFKPVSLSQFRGHPILISAVPSLDTPVCSIQTKHFNEALSTLPEDVVVITISMDLPTAQKRFCGKEDIKRMHVLSDSAKREFGERYGILISKRGLLARSVFVIGRDGRISYAQIVPEVSKEPDYDSALDAVKKAAELSQK